MIPMPKRKFDINQRQCTYFRLNESFDNAVFHMSSIKLINDRLAFLSKVSHSPARRRNQPFLSLPFYAPTFILRETLPPSRPHTSTPTMPSPLPPFSNSLSASAPSSTSPSPPASPPHSGSTNRSCHNIPAPAEQLEDISGNCLGERAGFVEGRCRRFAGLGERYGRAPTRGTRVADRKPSRFHGTGTW